MIQYSYWIVERSSSLSSRGGKEMSSTGSDLIKASTYWSDKLERKRQSEGGGGFQWLDCLKLAWTSVVNPVLGLLDPDPNPLVRCTVQIRILLSSSKNSKENLVLFCAIFMTYSAYIIYGFQSRRLFDKNGNTSMHSCVGGLNRWWRGGGRKIKGKESNIANNKQRRMYRLKPRWG